MKRRSNRCSSPVFVRFQTFSHAQCRTLWFALLWSSLATSAFAEPGNAYDIPGMSALRWLSVPIFTWSAVGILTAVLTNIFRAKVAPNNDPLPPPADAPPASPPPLRKPAPKPHWAWVLVGFTPAILFSLCWLWLGLKDPKYTNYGDHMTSIGLQVLAVSALLIIPPWTYLLLRSIHRPVPGNKRMMSRVVKNILTALAFMGANVAIVMGAFFLYAIFAILYFIVEPIIEILWASI